MKASILSGNLVNSVDYEEIAPFFIQGIEYICEIKLGKRSVKQRRLMDLKAIRVREMVIIHQLLKTG